MRTTLMKRTILLACTAALCAAAGGCSEYLARQDRISFAAGDAKSHNAAVHMVDPWPGHAFKTSIATPGVRAEKAMEQYRKGNTEKSAAPTFTPVLMTGGGNGSSGQ
ncbi:MAG: hypothetical protein AB7F96_01475 [Beijerinckiaceae bacterium]